MICLKCVSSVRLRASRSFRSRYEEAVAPREIDHVLQIGPHFVDGRAMVVGKTQTLFDLLLELAEDAVDDVVFVAEVVVQVAWTDFHLSAIVVVVTFGSPISLNSFNDSSSIRSRVRRGGLASMSSGPGYVGLGAQRRCAAL